MKDGRPARILFLNSRSEYGGSDMCLHAIVRYLDAGRFQSLVVLPHEGPLVPKLLDAGAEVLYLDICRLERLSNPAQLWTFARRFVGSLRQLRQIIRQRQIDLVYTNSIAIQVGALAARLERIPNVWHLREIWTSPRWLTGPLYRYVYAFADRIIAISQAVALGNFGHAGGKITVVRDGVDRARFEGLAPAVMLRYSEASRAAARDASEYLSMTEHTHRLLVTTVARLVPQKGLECFVEAARLAIAAGADARFCIAGDIPRSMYQGYKDHLLALIREYRLEGRVFLSGWCSDVPALLAASDLFVLSSIGPEGAGLVIPEAWLAGTPVIVPDHSGPREIVADGETGLWFHSGDAADLSEKICRLLGDGALRQELAGAGRLVALRQHDARRNTAEIAGILDELLAGARPKQL